MSDLAISSSADAQAPAGSIGASDAVIAANQLISFAIGDDQYGVDIMAVREIKGWTAITPLPGQPEYVRGVLNLRGVIVPIVDLRCRFGQGLTEATPLHIVIVVQIDGRPSAFSAIACSTSFPSIPPRSSRCRGSRNRRSCASSPVLSPMTTG